ncbi:MAG: VOC family protein [Cyanobacteria bacterium REEB65]|nr:VOC family protein [Cyanobacteria bacterium REEB65]
MPEFKVESIIPHLVVAGAAKALEFYRKAFGAEIVSQMPTPDGQRLIHAVIKIGGHEVYVVDEMPDREEGSMMRSPREAKGTTVSITLNVSDADAVYNQAVKVGATEHMPLENTFWGARYGQLLDPYGHLWEINQNVQQRSEAEMKTALEKDWAKSH